MITIKKIICPVDFSGLSRKALSYANEFAKLSGGEVFLVGVVEMIRRSTTLTDWKRSVRKKRKNLQP